MRKERPPRDAEPPSIKWPASLGDDDNDDDDDDAGGSQLPEVATSSKQLSLTVAAAAAQGGASLGSSEYDKFTSRVKAAACCGRRRAAGATYGDTVLRALAGDDFLSFRVALQVWPCRFRDVAVERLFAAHVKKNNGTRVLLTACVALLVHFAFFLAYTLLTYNNAFLLPLGVSMSVFATFQGILLAPAALLIVISLIPRLHGVLEEALYLCFGVSVAIMVSGFVYLTSHLRRGCLSKSHCLIVKDLVDSTVLVHVMATLLACTLVVQSRTRIAVWLVSVLVLLSLVTAVTQLGEMEALPDGTLCDAPGCVDPFPLSGFNVIYFFSQFGCQGYMAVFCFFWRWITELAERIDFYRGYKAERRAKQLQNRRRKKRRTVGYSAVEDIIDCIEHTQKMLDGWVSSAAANSGEPAELMEARVYLAKCLDVLSRGDDLLHQVHFPGLPGSTRGTASLVAFDLPHKHGTGMSSSVAAHALDVEGESGEEWPDAAAVEAQFYTMFGTKHENNIAMTVPAIAAARARGVTEGAGKGSSDGDPSSDDDDGGGDSTSLTAAAAATVPAVIASWDQCVYEDLRRSLGLDYTYDLLQASLLHPHIPFLMYGGFVLLGRHPLYAISSRHHELLRLVTTVDRLYQTVPYHNSLHGVTVAHLALSMARRVHLLDAVASSSDSLSLEGLILAWSALTHDVGHGGRGNAFYVGAVDPLAVVYSDEAVLERMHAALSLRVLQRHNSAIFTELSPEELKQFRSKCIELILATDMAGHFDTVNKVRIRRRSPEFNCRGDVDDFWLVARLCLKAADLGHAMADWPSHLRWSIMVAEEFYQVGDIEAAYGLPKSPLCDRTKHTEFAKSQRSFLEFVVLPLINEVEAVQERQEQEDVFAAPNQAVARVTREKDRLAVEDPFATALRSPKQNILYNINKWSSLEGESIEIPEEVRRVDIRNVLPPGELCYRWMFGTKGRAAGSKGASVAFVS